MSWVRATRSIDSFRAKEPREEVRENYYEGDIQALIPHPV